jgi:hypothetical protein
MDGWDRHRDRLDFGMRGKELIDRAEGAASEFLRNLAGAVGIAIDHADQPNRLTFVLELLIDADVIPPEGAYPHDRDGDGFAQISPWYEIADCRC